MHLNAVQVRKDLAPRIVGQAESLNWVSRSPILLRTSTAFWDTTTRRTRSSWASAVGQSPLGYGGFRNYGLNIVAAFDTNPSLIGKKISSVTVQSADKIQEFVRRQNVKIGIICVPKEFAQSVADELVEGGVRAIWNFAPAHLQLSEKIAVKNEDMAGSLAILSKRLEQILYNEK